MDQLSILGEALLAIFLLDEAVNHFASHWVGDPKVSHHMYIHDSTETFWNSLQGLYPYSTDLFYTI